MVNCSTIHVYGNGINEDLLEWRGQLVMRMNTQTISELYPILKGTLTPLHASKRTSEIYVQAYTDTYGMKAASFRLTGIYGPRQFGGEDHGWVANFAIRTILGLPIKVFGTDKQARDILYVKDAANAFLKWYEGGCPSGIYNIGGGPECLTSLGGCLEILKRQTGREQAITLEPFRQGDLYYFCCEIRKARGKFKWIPRVLPQEGISKLVEWINDNKEVFKK